MKKHLFYSVLCVLFFMSCSKEEPIENQVNSEIIVKSKLKAPILSKSVMNNMVRISNIQFNWGNSYTAYWTGGCGVYKWDVEGPTPVAGDGHTTDHSATFTLNPGAYLFKVKSLSDYDKQCEGSISWVTRSFEVYDSNTGGENGPCDVPDYYFSFEPMEFAMKITWDTYAQLKVRYKKDLASNWIYPSGVFNGKYAMISGLEPGEYYDFQFAKICNDEISGYTQTYTELTIQ